MTRLHRREWLRRVIGTAGLVSVTGCSQLQEADTTRTVAPDLTGTPASPDSFEASVTAPGGNDIVSTTGGVVVATATNDAVRFTGYDPVALSRTGAFSVPDSKAIAGVGTQRVILRDGDETVARAYPDGEKIWGYPARLEPLGLTPDPGVFWRLPDRRRVIRLDPQTGERQWRIETPHEFQTWDGSLVVFHDPETGDKHCYSFETGEKRWETSVPDPETASGSATGVHLGDAFVVASDGRIDIVDAADGTHRLLHPTAVNPYWSAHTDDRVFFGAEDSGANSGSGLVGLHARDGHQWTTGESLQTIRPIAVGELLVALAETTDGLATLGVEPASGEVRWRHRGAVVATDPDTAYVLGGGAVTAVAADGTTRWTREVPQVALPAVSIDGGRLASTFEPPGVARTDTRLVLAGASGVAALDTTDGAVTLTVTGLDEITDVAIETVDESPRVFVATRERLGTARV